MLRIPKLIVIAYKKNVYFSKLLLLQSFNSLRWNMYLPGVAYVINETYYYFIISIRKWSYSFIYYLIAYVPVLPSYRN